MYTCTHVHTIKKHQQKYVQSCIMHNDVAGGNVAARQPREPPKELYCASCLNPDLAHLRSLVV